MISGAAIGVGAGAVVTGSGLGAGGGLTPEAAALIARMTAPPSAQRATTINSLIVALKTAGVWAKLDGLYLLAAADAQAACLNWKSASYTATPVNAPDFTVDRGYASNGTTSYLNTGFQPSTAPSPAMSQNSAHIAVASSTTRAAASVTAVGCASAGTASDIYPYYTGGLLYARLNDSGGSVSNATGSRGRFIGSRQSAGSRRSFINGASAGDVAAASAALPASPIFICGRSASSAIDAPCTDRISFASFGAGLSDVEAAALDAAVLSYLQALGAD